ncbi:hypothetical protein LIER_06701 [Lithospermum erythrorhizon]|uniref:Uncharacterized protein n=1 Tax=Lithospermum erythrorhizon TaxID=34254 RepID=A0AAV3P6H8_LITER
MGKQPTHEVFLIYILRGLREEYKKLKSFVYTRDSGFSFEELHNYLVTHEFVNPDLSSVTSSNRGLLPTPPPTVNYVGRSSSVVPCMTSASLHPLLMKAADVTYATNIKGLYKPRTRKQPMGRNSSEGRIAVEVRKKGEVVIAETSLESLERGDERDAYDEVASAIKVAEKADAV